MADKALPLIFFNLSGEMIYVIQQRLEAQNISKDKSSKVIWDIVNTMLNDQFIEELFKPQSMYSRSAMQSVFEKLVHSSIMRLNTTSMSKLYDLMLMVFKYQVLNCTYSEDILLVTLNHMDAIKNCTAPYLEFKRKFENVYTLLISNYKKLSHHEFECLYNCIIVFLQDLNVRVSVLMRLGLQLPSGEIVVPESDNRPESSSVIFTRCTDSEFLDERPQEKWREMLPQNCFEIEGNRGICLGTNIYSRSFLMSEAEKRLPELDKKTRECYENEKFQALEEITLLSRLIGNSSQSEFVPEILLNPNEEDFIECRNTFQKNDCCFVTIDASQISRNELGQICNEFIVEEKKEKKDILELLDFAETDK